MPQTPDVFMSSIHSDQDFLERAIPGGIPEIDTVKREAKTMLTLKNSTRLCTLILMTNLASPQFLYIDCCTQYTYDALCMGTHSKKTTLNSQHTTNASICSSLKSVVHNHTCFTFVFAHSINAKTLLQGCKVHRMELFRINSVAAFLDKLDFIIAAIFPSLPEIFSMDQKKPRTLLAFSYDSTLGKSLAQVKAHSKTIFSGTFACLGDLQPVLQAAHLYQCSASQAFILSYFLKDLKIDCPDNDTSDESLNLTAQFQDQTICSPLLHTQRNGQCTKVVLNSAQLFVRQNNSLANLNSHIGLSSTKCYSLGKIPCNYGQTNCYDIVEICSYHINSKQILFPCENGEHLENCLSFECNGMFKCPHHYCVPWTYVCDNKWDCPWGVDEIYSDVCGPNATCSGLFKCAYGKQACIHLGNVCNFHTDCLSGEDETFCELKSTICPQGCQCLVFALVCYRSSLSFMKQKLTYPFLKVVISSATFDNPDVFCSFQNATFVSLKNTNLSSINFELLSPNASFLNLAQNRLTKIMFHQNKNVLVFHLQNNMIHSLKETAFHHLRHLKFINISDNPIEMFSLHVFDKTCKLWFVSILNINFAPECLKRAHMQTIKFIDATDHSICCFYNEIACKVSEVWHETCADLLPSIDLKMLFLCLSLLAFILHLCSLFLHLCVADVSNAFKVIVIGYEITEVVAVVFYVLVSAFGHKLSENFSLHEKQWRSEASCFVAFTIAMWAAQASPLILLLLSVGRAKVVLSPFTTSFKRSKFTSKCTTCTFLITLVTSVLCTVFVRVYHGSLPHELCSPFADDTHTFWYIRVTTILLLLLDIASSVLILVFHAVLVINFKKSKQSVAATKNFSSDIKSLKIQLFSLSLSDVLLLASSKVGFIVLQYLHKYPLSVPHYLTLNLPLHSLLISLIFIIFILSKQCSEGSTRAHSSQP